MKKLLIAALILFPSIALAITVPWNRPSAGLVDTLYPADVVRGDSYVATSTTATSTLPKLETTTFKISTAIEIIGEYITNFTTYVRSLFTGGDGITITNGDIDCDTASGSTFGCLSASDWTLFNSKLTAYDAFTHPAAGQSATTSLMVFNGNASTTALTVSGDFYPDNATGIWNASGNIGVATTSPAVPLHVVASGAASVAFDFLAGATFRMNEFRAGSNGSAFGYDANTVFSIGTIAAHNQVTLTNTYFRLDASGNVGLSTVSPLSLFHMATTSSATTWSSSYTTASGQSFTPFGHELTIDNSTDATTDSFAGIFFKAGETSAGSAINAARIAAIRTAGITTDLAFAVRGTASSNAMVEAMRIQSGGRVGIGTTTPPTKLFVDVGNIGVRPSTSGSTNDKFFRVYNTLGAERMSLAYDNINVAMHINGNSGTPLVTVKGLGGVEGNVGIGTTTPATKLSVQGNGLFSGDLSVANLTATGTLSLAGTTYSSLLAGTTSPTTGQILTFHDTSGTKIRGANGASFDDNGFLTINNQININGAWTQFQATTANVDLNFKTVAGTGDIVLTTGNTDLAWFTDTGRVGIGTNAPGLQFHVSTSTLEGNIFRLQDSDGTCDHDPDSGSEVVSCSSDENLKENIRDAGSTLAFLSGFRVREYEVRKSGNTMTGVIAQEVEQIHPTLVTDRVIEESDGLATSTVSRKFVEMPSIWTLVKAVQELASKDTAIEARLDALEARVTKLENDRLVLGAVSKAPMCSISALH